MRTIKIYSTVGTAGEVVTNVTTLRELKPLLRDRDIDYSGMKLVVGETRNELSIDEAVLPEGDFKLYLMPQKTKSGGIDDDIERIEDKLEFILDKLNQLLSKGGCNVDRGVPVYTPATTSPRDADEDAALRDMKNIMGHSEEDSW